MPSRSSWFAASALALVLPASAAAKLGPFEFPPVTARDKALAEVPGHPYAPAVVLWRRGTIRYAFSFGQGVSAWVSITQRLKVLAEAGKPYGEVELLDRPGYQLGAFAARTVTASGRVVPLAADAVFTSRSSKRRKIDRVRLALPEVEIGSLLDLHVEYLVGSFLWLEPWSFQQEVPTLLSEVVFEAPEILMAEPWLRDPLAAGVRTESTLRRRWSHTRAWVENAPALPAEPHAPPASELAARFSLVPFRYTGNGRFASAMLYTWNGLGEELRATLSAAAQVASVRSFASDLVRDIPRQRTEARARRLFTFVRDEVTTFAEVASSEPSLPSVPARRRTRPSCSRPCSTRSASRPPGSSARARSRGLSIPISPRPATSTTCSSACGSTASSSRLIPPSPASPSARSLPTSRGPWF